MSKRVQHEEFERGPSPDAVLVDEPAPAEAQIFYVLTCRECEPQLPMPFASPSERGKWAAAHTRGTGHDRWLVLDQPRDPAAASLSRPSLYGSPGGQSSVLGRPGPGR